MASHFPAILNRNADLPSYCGKCGRVANRVLKVELEPGEHVFLFAERVSAGRNYEGMFLSHFSHADPGHLIFNMMTLYYFGPVVEDGLGMLGMLAVYIIAGICSTVVVYYRHRSQPGYRALGASVLLSALAFAVMFVHAESVITLLAGQEFAAAAVPLADRPCRHFEFAHRAR